MPSVGPVPLAVDLDVLKLGTTEDPVSRDDVERALYALTGWQKPQHLVDSALDVVDSYAHEVRAGRVVPARNGHGAVACGRAHLDDHVCEVKVVEVPLAAPARQTTPVADERPLDGVTYRDTRALDQAQRDVEQGEPGRRVRTGVRNEPTMTPGELLLVDGADVDQLSDAQRAARHTLLINTQGCSACGSVKSLDDFYKDRARLTGRASRCKECANAATAARRGKKTPR